MTVKQLKHKIENAQKLRADNPHLKLDEKFNKMYDLLLEIEDLKREKENATAENMELPNISKEIQKKETEVCMLEYEVRCIAHQIEDTPNEFVQASDVLC